ncbi:hypothetical protein E4U53_002631 [Claviceps sorghi]|nr:hypothetical protein E4U53_002631 [Claviceps sorghi]
MTPPIKHSDRSRTAPESATKSDQYPSMVEECAIGDSDDDDEELVQIRRVDTQNRMQHQKSPEELRRALIPFHWAPMLSPFTPADLPACIALEHAALPDQNQSCSAERIFKSHEIGVMRRLLQVTRPWVIKYPAELFVYTLSPFVLKSRELALESLP